MTTLAEITAAAAKFFAAESAAVEIEYTLVLGSHGTMQVWVGRDLEIFDHPRFAN